MNKLILYILLLIPLLLNAQDKQNKGADQKMLQLSRARESQLSILKQAEYRNDKIAIAHSLGYLGKIYLDLAKQASRQLRQNDSTDAGIRANLNKAIEYSSKSIKAGEEVGDVDQMKKSYKNLSAAQKLAGDLPGALISYRKMVSLKHNSKKALKIEQKHLEYKYGRREDSLVIRKQIVEEHLEKQTQKLTEKQKELEVTNKTLLIAEKEKDLQASDLKLQQSQLKLQKSELELQKSNLQLQKNELAKKDRDIEEHKKERNFYISGIIALLIISLLAYRTIWQQKKYNKAIVKEKQRSEDLLLNILPAEVAEELKEKGFADAKHFENVTVLFTDFVSFTSMAETMSPEQLVGELHICFKAFDEILGKYRIEKIKTIGDAYMAVSGLPVSNPDHAVHIIEAAIEIRNFMQQRKSELGSKTFGVRIGINSGNAVAGIVGVRKFSYDIWGDTVNIASRMEQHSEEGKINISKTTYLLVKDKYSCEYRGKIEAKNKGSIDMYFLT